MCAPEGSSFFSEYFKKIDYGTQWLKPLLSNPLFHQQLSLWPRKQRPGWLLGSEQTVVHIMPPKYLSNYLEFTRQRVIFSVGYHALLAGKAKLTSAAPAQPGAELCWAPASKGWGVVAGPAKGRPGTERGAAAEEEGTWILLTMILWSPHWRVQACEWPLTVFFHVILPCIIVTSCTYARLRKNAWWYSSGICGLNTSMSRKY